MYIVMDLEFNCTNNSYVSEKNGVRLPNEIIEIGARDNEPSSLTVPVLRATAPSI